MAGVSSEGTQVNASGRVVWGHPLRATEKKDPATGQVVRKPDGSPVIQHVFGLAIDKQQFETVVWPAMYAEASKGYPAGAPQNFAWKYDNGDDPTPRQGGRPFSEREGYPGHYVLTVSSSTGFPPALYKFNGTNYDQLTENDIKTGDYVNAALNFVVNVPTQRTHTPSLYVNPQALEFLGYGTAIQSAGVNPMQAFGGQQRALPPGASATPISGAAGSGVAIPGTTPGNPTMPQPGAMGTPMPGAPAAMPNAGYPAQAPQPANTAYPSNPAQQLPPPHTQFVQPGAPAGYPAQPQPGYPAQPVPGGMPGLPGPR